MLQGVIGERGEPAIGDSFEAELVRATRRIGVPLANVGEVEPEIPTVASVSQKLGQVKSGNSEKNEGGPAETDDRGNDIPEGGDIAPLPAQRRDMSLAPILEQPEQPMHEGLGAAIEIAAPIPSDQAGRPHMADAERGRLSTSAALGGRDTSERGGRPESIADLVGGLIEAQKDTEKGEMAIMVARSGALSTSDAAERSKDVRPTPKIDGSPERIAASDRQLETSLPRKSNIDIAPLDRGEPLEPAGSAERVSSAAPVGGPSAHVPFGSGYGAKSLPGRNADPDKPLAAGKLDISTQSAPIPGAQAPKLEGVLVPDVNLPLPTRRVLNDLQTPAAGIAAKPAGDGPSVPDIAVPKFSPAAGNPVPSAEKRSGERRDEEKIVDRPIRPDGGAASRGGAIPALATTAPTSFATGAPPTAGADGGLERRVFKEYVPAPHAVTPAPVAGANTLVPPSRPPAARELTGAIDDIATRKIGPGSELAGLPSEPQIIRMSDRPAPLHGVNMATTAHRAVEQIVMAASTAADGSVEIRLDPEELGRVKLRLHGHEGAMAVTVIAERAETLDLLRRHIDQLAAQLSEIGYRELSFGFAGQGQGFDEQNEETLTPPADVVSEAETPEKNVLARSRLNAHSQENGMDLRV